MSLKTLALLLLLTLCLAACGTADSNTPAVPTATATPAPREVLVDTAWVEANLGRPGIVFVDTSGDRRTYAAGHLPGAVYVNILDDLADPDDPIRGEILQRDALTALFSRLDVRNDDLIVLYDDSSNLDAARAYWVLKYYRHAEVRIYDGGSRKWVGEGNELVQDAVALELSSYVAGEPDPEIRTDWDYVVGKLGQDGTLFCDTRSLQEYTGAMPQAARGGHIPGAIHVEWTAAVNPDGTFRDLASLRKLYEDAGFLPDKEIITYCQIGVRAAHTWFVLHELLNYPSVRIYDGSWIEYGNNEASPIDK